MVIGMCQRDDIPEEETLQRKSCSSSAVFDGPSLSR